MTILHKAFHRNRLTTKYFHHFRSEKPATHLEVTRSQSTEDRAFPQFAASCARDAHPLCRLLPHQTLETSRQSPNPLLMA